MTLGIDVSPLFSEMCLVISIDQLSYTKDIISKKMIYFYLINYAETNPSLALMAINSFKKDCEDKDVKIKGLALRSLCSLKFDGVYDYAKGHVLLMLNDHDPYIRNIAINGCLKLHYLNPKFVEGAHLLPQKMTLLTFFTTSSRTLTQVWWFRPSTRSTK